MSEYMMARIGGLCAGVVFALLGCAPASDEGPGLPAFVPASCEVGIYDTSEGFVVVTRRGSGFGYALSDGHHGVIAEDSGVECGEGALRLRGAELAPRRATRVTDVEFESNGTRLVAKLIEPVDADATTPLVVLAHGSEETPWLEVATYPYQLVGRGVSVFVYDKRGTGQSQGVYSQNFPELADDLVAASSAARTLADDRFGAFGLIGFSQGGWIVPLAAERADAQFLAIGYGLVVDILEEDAAQVELELREAGYDDAVIEQARAVTDVTARLAVSGYTDGLDDLDALRERFGDEPWFARIRGGFSGVLLGMPSQTLRDEGIPMFDRLNIDWSLKPMDVLREVHVPMLWVLAEDDREAPIATTLERLDLLRQEGKEIETFVFPNTDHGMWEFEQGADLTRVRTRVTDRYYDLIADWAHGDVEPPYADSHQH